MTREELIKLPHPVSKKHKPMAMSDRAAQFSPFAALTGFEEEIDEAGRKRVEEMKKEKLI
ncbi:MAG: hypothetical protein IKW90_08340 [Lachnospiraceae bacterium]|nr:hypothetical protein [Lachnospiraceae bacterium]